ALAGLAGFAAHHDLRRAFRDRRAWEAMVARFAANPLYRHTSARQAVELARCLYRYLVPLAVPVPEVDVCHSSAAALCVLPALVAKLERGTPLVVSEHGVYLRERILELVRRQVHPLGKVMFANLYRGLATASYRFADAVVPVCEFNARWEAQLGVDPDRVEVVHNGADPQAFAPRPWPEGPPTVAWVGRLDPLKDVLGLLRAARLVHAARPEVRFRLWGPDSDPAYARRCRLAARAMGLDQVVSFEGPTDDVPAAYGACQLAVLSSVSEGFPYAVIEAMACARPVVATAVGGVPEALDRPELLVEPGNAAALARAVLDQLARPLPQRQALGQALRARAVERFSAGRCLDAYDALYRRLAPAGAPGQEAAG
ncbi:MAG TPA: GT4 family glycosyltransferase PelF, partial [Acidimicrobiales bacterium]|nr:GT4 family glycosyltransferase PelF [Acidimicrobiales bacterium]